MIVNSTSEIRQTAPGLANGETDPEARSLETAGWVCFRNRMGRALFFRLAAAPPPVGWQATGLWVDARAEDLVTIYARVEDLGREVWTALRDLDIGARVLVEGRAYRTLVGGWVLRVTRWRSLED